MAKTAEKVCYRKKLEVKRLSSVSHRAWGDHYSTCLKVKYVELNSDRPETGVLATPSYWHTRLNGLFTVAAAVALTIITARSAKLRSCDLTMRQRLQVSD